jgi:hypothetical protein
MYRLGFGYLVEVYSKGMISLGVWVFAHCADVSTANARGIRLLVRTTVTGGSFVIR